MGQSTERISRALGSYGQRAAGIAGRSAASAGALRQHAGDTRARGIEQRGRTFGNVIAGAGQAVGQELAMRPVRQQEQERHNAYMDQADINAERGEIGLEADQMALEGKKEQAQRAREVNRIFAESKPGEIVKNLNDGGFVREAYEVQQSITEARSRKLDLSAKERAKEEADGDMLADLTDLRGVEEDQIGGVLAQRWAKSAEFLTEQIGPVAEELFTGDPTPGDLDYLSDVTGAGRNWNALMTDKKIASEAEKAKLETADARRERVNNEIEDVMKHLHAVGDKGLPSAVTSAIGNASPEARDKLKELFGGPGAKTSDRRATIKAYRGIEDKQKYGLPGEYEEHKKGGGTGTFLEFVKQRSAATAKPKPEGGAARLTVSQAQQRLSALKRDARKAWETGEYATDGEKSVAEILEMVAAKEGEDLKELQAMASGRGAPSFVLESLQPAGGSPERDTFTRTINGVVIEVERLPNGQERRIR